MGVVEGIIVHALAAVYVKIVDIVLLVLVTIPDAHVAVVTVVAVVLIGTQITKVIGEAEILGIMEQVVEQNRYQQVEVERLVLTIW